MKHIRKKLERKIYILGPTYELGFDFHNNKSR
jgi:hypothetical protein